jgi:hypothetical protein
MIEFKNLLLSRTVWANAVGLAALLLSMFGFNVPVIEKEQLVEAILQVVTGGSFVASTIFRILATKKISL